jgi:hypothetical protein
MTRVEALEKREELQATHKDELETQGQVPRRETTCQDYVGITLCIVSLFWGCALISYKVVSSAK